MIHIAVKLDTAQLKRALAELGRKAPQAIRRAINRTARSARTDAVRAVAREVKLPQKDVRPMLPVIPATVQFLEAKLVARGRPISLLRLGARQTKLGVVYRGPAGPVLLRSAFIATMPRAKRPAVWRRTLPSERKSRRAWSKNLPIERQLGPSVPRLVIEKGIFEAVRSRAQQTLAKNMAHETEYLLSRREGRRG
jgi:hypothetical protein